MRKVLEGIKVLDFTQYLSGPFCTMNLADFGAEVVKIERPGTGEVSRTFGPFLNGQSSYYTLLNRGKKSVTLDLVKGREAALALIRECDILVENFRPGVMQRLGLDYDRVKDLNPRLIYCSLSGFGQDSPFRDQGAYDLVAQGMSGLLDITGYPDEMPARTGCSVGDLSASMYGLSGILLALYDREKTGRGQMLDIAMLDGTFALLEVNVARYTIGGVEPKRVGSRHPISAPFDLYRCRDGLVVIAIANDHHFSLLCQLMNQPELATDPRFREDADRSVNDKALKEIIEVFLKDYTVREITELLHSVGVPSSEIASVREACSNPSLLHREMLVTIDQPGMGKVRITGNPIKMSETPPDPEHAAPLLGQNTEEVLTGLGYTQEQLSEWREKGII